MALNKLALLVGSLLSLINPKSTPNYKSKLYYSNEYTQYLSNPSKIKDIQYEGFKFPFQDGNLPEFPVTKFNVITANNIPILFEFISYANESDIRSYYFALDSKTSKMSNYIIEDAKPLLDSAGLKYYQTGNVPTILNQLPTLESNAAKCNLGNYRVSELIDGLLLTIEIGSGPNAGDIMLARIDDKYIPQDNKVEEDKLEEFVVVVDNDIESIVDTKTIKPSLYYSRTQSPNYSIFSYSFDEKQQDALKQNYKIEQITFNNISLIFDAEAKLTKNDCWSIEVFTCKHKNPLLVRTLGVNGYAFYSICPHSGLWNNHIVVSLYDLEQEERDGIEYYKYDTLKEVERIQNEAVEECSDLCKIMCHDDLIAYITYPDKPSLEIVLKEEETEVEKEIHISEPVIDVTVTELVQSLRSESVTPSTGKPLSTFKSLRTSLLGQYDSLVNRLHISQPGLNEDLVYYSQRELDVTLHTLDSLISRLDSSPDDWLSIAADLLDSINRLTRLVDSTYIKVMDTLKTDKARSTLAQDYMTYKSENLSYMLDSLSLLISDIPNADPKSVEEFESIRHASKTSPRNHLAANRPDLQICFDELSAQTMNATKSFKRVIESAQDDQDPEDNQPYTPDQPSDPKANDEDTDKDKDPSACILPRMLALLVPVFFFFSI